MEFVIPIIKTHVLAVVCPVLARVEGQAASAVGAQLEPLLARALDLQKDLVNLFAEVIAPAALEDFTCWLPVIACAIASGVAGFGAGSAVAWIGMGSTGVRKLQG